jgi:hypothetical protein
MTSSDFTNPREGTDDDGAVAAIYLALAAGDTELALHHAIECFDQGRALRVVAATIIAYGPADARRQRATDALAIIDALTAAAEQPTESGEPRDRRRG